MTASAVRVWRAVAASAAGGSHLERDLPCQDAHAVVTTDQGLLVIAAADGAGSAPRSDEGARAAVDAAVAAAVTNASSDPAHAARAAVESARAAIVETAGDGDPRDFAATLTVVVGNDGRLAAAQVGDGAVVIRRGGELSLLGPVERGEFLNETCFLTSSECDDELRLDMIDETDAGECGIDGIAVMTDGLQLLAFDLSAGTPHPGFFEPLFDWAAQPQASGEELATFLNSKRVCARTDDDKTLILATRIRTAEP